jgi:hypothetical protein
MALTATGRRRLDTFLLWLARRRWTRRPYRPVRYGIVVRIADAYAGHRDGSGGLPVVPPGEPGAAAGPGHPGARMGTPRLEAIRHRTREQIEQERIALERDQARWTERLLALGPRLAELTTEEEILRGRLDAARASLSPDELGRRRFAEGDRPATLVRSRRLAEQDRRQAELAAEHVTAVDRLAAARRSAAVLEQLTTRRTTVARARSRRLQEHACRRGATYWQQLLRSHPDGGALNGRLNPIGPDLPGWVTDDDPPEDGR